MTYCGMVGELCTIHTNNNNLYSLQENVHIDIDKANTNK